MQDPGGQAFNQFPPWIPPFFALLLVMVIAGRLLMPLARAWARRIEGRAGNPELLNEIAQLRERVAELEARSEHIAELEDRLDFAERLIAQRNDAPQLPLHRTPV